MTRRLLGYLLIAALSQSAASAQDAAPATEAAATLALKTLPPIRVKSGIHADLLTSFSSPAPDVRPRVRYWVPQAAVTEAGIRRDVQMLASQGFGGIELVSMDMPQGIPASYAWGTPRWNRMMAVAASEAARNHLSFSVANGPSWPIAMPGVISADHPGSLFELTYGETLIEAGSRYRGKVPAGKVRHAEGTPKLEALLAYPLKGERALDMKRVIDLTRTAQAGGGAISFTPPTRAERWILLAFWGQPATQKVGPLYVIDHFAIEGARASGDYWKGIFAAGLKRGAIDDIFNDSLEYKVSMDWTRDLPAAFRAQHGYDLAPYLPFIGFGNTYPRNDIPGFTSTDPIRAAQVNQDYFDTLSSLHIQNHLAPLQAMAEEHGANIRYQVGYNKPIGIETAAAVVGTPETEALGRGAVDGMRQMAAAVHLLGKGEFSVESAAEFGNGYGQSLRDILWWSKRAWAAGVNSETLHGAAYDGGYDGPGNVDGLLPGVEWPGYHPFDGKVTNIWSRETSPLFSRTLTAYLARGNALLRRRAKVDVAIFRAGLDVFNDPDVGHGDGQALYPDGGVLADRGFSYDFISPALLAMPQSEARDGSIAPEGPAYRVLLVPDARMISLADLARFEALAARGVRILFVGDLPRHSRSFSAVLRGETDDRVGSMVARLVAMDGVARVDAYDQVPRKLDEMGVRADAEAMTGGGVLAQHRVDGTNHIYYLYNYNQVSSKDAGTVINRSPDRTSYPALDAGRLTRKTVRFSLAGTGRPYLLDAWSGTITPLPAYTVRQGRVELTLSFNRDEAVFVGLLDNHTIRTRGLPRPSRHLEADHAANEDILYRAGTLGRRVSSTGIAIGGWQLSFAGVAKPASGTSAFALSERRTVRPLQVGTILKPLRELSSAFRDMAGTATYHARVALPVFSRKGSGYLLDLGRVEGPYAVSVNGQGVKDVDQLDSVLDISTYLKAGSNSVEITVATTLCGSVRCDPPRDEGLLGIDGRIMLRPYRFETIP